MEESAEFSFTPDTGTVDIVLATGNFMCLRAERHVYDCGSESRCRIQDWMGKAEERCWMVEFGLLPEVIRYRLAVSGD